MNIKNRMRLNRALPWVKLIAAALIAVTLLVSIGATYFVVTSPAMSASSQSKGARI